MADVPHFDLPFRWDSAGRARVVEQDSVEDVMNSVEAIFRTEVGSREDDPTFGIPDPTFSKIPLDVATMEQAVLSQEPRAFLVIDQAPDQFLKLAQNVRVSVAVRDPGEVSGV